MRSTGLTGAIRLAGTVFITLMCVALLQPAAATAPLAGDAVDLIGGAADTQGGQLAAADGIADAAGEHGDGQHPVYHLRPEPFSDEGALTLGLDELLVLAVEHNLGLARQYYSIEKSHYSVDQTYYAFDPALSTSLTYSHGASSTGSGTATGSNDTYYLSTTYSVPREYGDGFQFSYALNSLGNPTAGDTRKSYSLNVGYNRPLSRGAGRYYNRSGRFIASNSLLLAYDKLDDDVRNLKKHVLDAYYLAVSARQAIAVREASLDVALQQLERTVERYKVGMAIRTEMLQAENSVLTQRVSLLDAHKNYDDLLDSLSLLLGVAQEIRLSVGADGALIVLGSELPEDLWQLVMCNSYELKSLNTQLNNLRLSRDQQLHQLKPDVGLSLNVKHINSDTDYGELHYGPGDQSYDAAITWSTTPGQRGARAGLAQAELDLASLELSIQELELSIKARLRELARDLSTRQRQIELSEGNLAVVRETLSIQQERHEVGLAVTLDVVEAQEAVLAAELALLSAQVSYQQAYREILLMAGLI